MAKPKPLGDLSKPLEGDVLSPRPRTADRRLRARTSEDGMRELMDKQVRHIENALEHRGHKPTRNELTEFRTYLKGAIAAVQPFNADGSEREAGNMDVFLRISELFVRCCAVLMPYETPRLAAIAYRKEYDEPQEVQDQLTSEELRITLIKRGLPIDHIIESDRRLTAIRQERDGQ